MTSSPVLDRHGPGPGHPGGDGPVFVAEKKARHGRRPRALTASAVLIAAVLALPLIFLLIEASGSGAAADARLIFRPLTAELLWNTVRLTVVVTALCGVIGTAAAWTVERTNVPGRKIWAVLVVVPLAIPDFVVSFGWASLWTWIHGFRGAVIVMTLAVYPLVYLPVAASLRGTDPGQEEVARSLGTGRVRTFLRITLGQARGAILGGCLLVAMVLLAEYGAFEIVGYQTFTTEIFTEIGAAFSLPAACALALVLVVLSLVVLAGEGLSRGRGRVSRSGPLAQRVTPPQRLGRARLPVLAGFVLLTGLALGVPVAASVYWMTSGIRPSLSGVPLLTSAGYTALYGVLAGVLAIPGVVIALALSYFTQRYLGGFAYQTGPLLILAYAIMFFPLALVGVKASLARAPVSLDEVARSLGQSRLAVALRVTLRLTGPGLVAAFCLVFLSVITELTATLILIPIGVQTLATQFWAYETNLSYAQAAPFALVMIAVAAIPSIVLGRFFNTSADGTRMVT